MKRDEAGLLIRAGEDHGQGKLLDDAMARQPLEAGDGWR